MKKIALSTYLVIASCAFPTTDAVDGGAGRVGDASEVLDAGGAVDANGARDAGQGPDASDHRDAGGGDDAHDARDSGAAVDAAQSADASSANPTGCSFSVTENVYDGPGYWGTIAFKNNGPSASSSYKISFDVPSGATCDYADSGWTSSQQGVTCIYAHPGATLAAGASQTLQYSTDSTAFSAAANVQVTDSSCSGSGDATPPSAPSGLKVKGVTSSSVSLTWNASTDNVQVAGYDVFQSGAQVASETATTATVGSLAPSTSYSFQVRARDAAGNASALSPAVQANTAAASGNPSLRDAAKKEIALELVASNEESTLDWRAEYSYIEDIGDGRGYTAGLIGLCSGTGDMLEMVEHYQAISPGNLLSKYISALQKLGGSDAHTGLDPNFVGDWKTASTDSLFQTSYDWERDSEYFDPAVDQAIADGLRVLGQYIYFDSMVILGPGTDSTSQGGVRATAMKKAKTPAQGGDETTYLNAYLDAYVAAMLTDSAHQDTSRVETESRVFLKAGNLDLDPPLSWHTYGDPYSIP